jgi:XTP/dITP diphosphohydrolase
MVKQSIFVVASNNKNKITEIKSLFAADFFDIKSCSDLNIPSIAETGSSFLENSKIKANNSYNHCRFMTLADDSGLVVPSLNGDPGIFSSRYSGNKSTDHTNNLKLMREMQGMSKDDRKAFYVCSLVFLHPIGDKKITYVVEKKWHGMIAEEYSMTEKDKFFGYDPIFIPEGSKTTVSSMTIKQKNIVSHRGKALKEMQKIINRVILKNS